MSEQRILMGVVGRPHGVRGLVHVHSYAAVPSDLARYGVLTDERGGAWTLRWRGEGIAELIDATGAVLKDRDQAATLANRKLYVERDRLPEPDADEFYLADLIGLAAVERTGDGERLLGTVLAVHDYGAGTSLEVGDAGRSVMLPFTRACVPEIEIGVGRIVVVMPDEIEVPDAASLEAHGSVSAGQGEVSP
ncbi:ribosome maturation factor RimM [Lichenicola sp.]|uniref:ribosome maturation factor RimM n=1 Tax=Lichenicola sp. TaxID=2804529 RepID=UPI003B007C30